MRKVTVATSLLSLSGGVTLCRQAEVGPVKRMARVLSKPGGERSWRANLMVVGDPGKWVRGWQLRSPTAPWGRRSESALSFDQETRESACPRLVVEVVPKE